MGRGGANSSIDNIDTVLLFSHLNFIRSGAYGNDGLQYNGTQGYYRSFKVAPASDDHAYILRFYSTTLTSIGNYFRGSGYSLRCLAR